MAGARWWWRWWWRQAAVVVVVVVVVVCGGVEGGGDSRVKLVLNGYEGVVVGVSQEVEERDGPAIVEALKELFEEVSRRLFQATERRAFIRVITILLPRQWTTVNTTHHHSSETFLGSDIRVDEPSGVYKHQPYTVQSGGCGDGGEYIHLTPQYLLDDAEALWYGPRGKVVLLEWAKYRWGVFDELGYAGDNKFPLFYYKPEGGERYQPTLCANRPILGRRLDKGRLAACSRDRDGSPDEMCRFVSSRQQTASSSLMSYPLIKSDQIRQFCGASSGGGARHDSSAPTKQNLVCDGRSVWQVMRQHEDFRDGSNPPTESFAALEVRVVQQSAAHFVLVLDYSGSMNDHSRVHKLRRTARRWLLHDVAQGSHVAIVRFSDKAMLLHRMTEITDEASRKGLADAIETKADGATSIGAGLSVAARNVLAGKSNPVIVLITDGEENTNPKIDNVMQEVIASGARVITVAYGAAADPKLESLAEASGGKTFTVNDVDKGQMLEDAFLGALTYQPPPPTALQMVTIHEEEYQGGGNEASSSFNVDFTVGRNLTLRLETGTKGSATAPQVTLAPVLIDPVGKTYTNANFDPDSSTWTLVVPVAMEGRWTWKVGLSGERDGFVIARVTAQPRHPNVQPITTRAWVSSGARDVNASSDRVIIFAEVKQGQNPVVDADVRALVTPPDESAPDEVYVLLDNGQGADRLAGDGIYSRYMTVFPSTGRYSVKAQVTSGGRAVINQGFLTSPQKIRRKRKTKEEEEEEEEEEEMSEEYIKQFLSGPDICCGSEVPLPPHPPPTGDFYRTSTGGSIKVSSVFKGDVLPPSRVTDLKVDLKGLGWSGHTLPTLAHVTLTFTAPGDDYDAGVVSEYDLRMTSNREELTEAKFTTHSHSSSTTTTTSSSTTTSTSSSNSSSSTWRAVDLSGHPVEVEGGTFLSLNLSLTLSSSSTFFALRAYDKEGNPSEVSNIAFLHLNSSPLPPSHVGGWGLVVVVVVVVVCLVVVVVMLCLARKRRKTGVQITSTQEKQKPVQSQAEDQV